MLKENLKLKRSFNFVQKKIHPFKVAKNFNGNKNSIRKNQNSLNS